MAASEYERIGEIVGKICKDYDVDLLDLLGRSRKKAFVLARHKAMFEVRKQLGFSTLRIGRIFDRDHTTVVHALKKFEGSLGL